MGKPVDIHRLAVTATSAATERWAWHTRPTVDSRRPMADGEETTHLSARIRAPWRAFSTGGQMQQASAADCAPWTICCIFYGMCSTIRTSTSDRQTDSQPAGLAALPSRLLCWPDRVFATASSGRAGVRCCWVRDGSTLHTVQVMYHVLLCAMYGRARTQLLKIREARMVGSTLGRLAALFLSWSRDGGEMYQVSRRGGHGGQ